jgi:predicted transposase YbfD/YdcC
MQESHKGFLDYFQDLPDPRIDRKKLHRVDEILLLTLTAVICGAEGWQYIELFGQQKLGYLRKFLPYANGVPSDDTLRRLFRRINPQEFQKRFTVWAENLKTEVQRLIAIDGKVSRHSFDGDKSPLYTVSAFASEARLVLAQTKVSDKSNEITAIPELLDLLDISGAIVTIDAMGCQREIAGQIIESKADYVLSLKGNQGTLHKDIKLVFSDGELLKELDASSTETIDGGHGRIETRKCKVLKIPEVLAKIHQWPRLKTIIEIDSIRELKDHCTREKRYYISSLESDAAALAPIIRSHWSIENSLHWILDVSFNDDASRIRKGNGPQNIGIIKHTALNMLQQNRQKRESIKGLRKAAGWNDERLTQIIQQ